MTMDKELARIADALERIAKAMEKSHHSEAKTPKNAILQYDKTTAPKKKKAITKLQNYKPCRLCGKVGPSYKGSRGIGLCCKGKKPKKEPKKDTRCLKCNIIKRGVKGNLCRACRADSGKVYKKPQLDFGNGMKMDVSDKCVRCGCTTDPSDLKNQKCPDCQPSSEMTAEEFVKRCRNNGMTAKQISAEMKTRGY
jgi:hypothetical protein